MTKKVLHQPLRGRDPKEILARYMAGETGTQIATSLGISKQCLSHWLRHHAEDDWREAQLAKALDRKERAEEDLETFSETFKLLEMSADFDHERAKVALMHARERLKSAQWDLERVYRRIYGTDQPPDTGRVTINLNIGESKPAVTIDAEVVEQKK